MVTIEQDQAKGRELQYILFELAKSQEMMGDREAYQAMCNRLEALYFIPARKTIVISIRIFLQL